MVTSRDYVDAITDELEEWPGVTFEFVKGKKHHHAVLRFNGKQQKKYFPSSPSDAAFGVVRAVADVRRSCSVMGATRLPPRNKKRAAEDRPAPRPAPPRAAAPALAPQSPFAPLQKLQASLTAEQLGPWARFRVPVDMLDKGARHLIKVWHPQFILRAAELISQSQREENADDTESEGSPESAGEATENRRAG